MALDPSGEGRKYPPFPIDRILKERDRLRGLLARHAGRVPEGDAFLALAGELAYAIGAAPSDPAVAETVRALPRAPLSPRALGDLCWRVAARKGEILKGRPARPWAGQAAAEAMAFEVLSGRPHRFRDGSAGFEYRCRVLAGSACPEVACARWSSRAIGRVARELGFTRRGRKKRPYGHPLELVRLRFAAMVMPDRAAERPVPDPATIAAPGKLRAHNVALLDARIRREPPCPHGFAHPCRRCPAGYAGGGLVCPAAVRPLALQLRHCGGCGRESFFDPEAPSDACVDCTPG